MLSIPTLENNTSRVRRRPSFARKRPRNLQKQELMVDCSTTSSTHSRSSNITENAGPEQQQQTASSSSSCEESSPMALPLLSNTTASTFVFSPLDDTDDEEEEECSIKSPEDNTNERRRKAADETLPQQQQEQPKQKESDNAAAAETENKSAETAAAASSPETETTTAAPETPPTKQQRPLPSPTTMSTPVSVLTGHMIRGLTEEGDSDLAQEEENEKDALTTTAPTTPLPNNSTLDTNQADTADTAAATDLTGDSAIRRLWNTPVRLRQGLRQRRRNYLSRRAAAMALRRQQQHRRSTGCPHRPKRGRDDCNYWRQRRKQRWLIPAEHPLKLLWDLLTVVLSFLNAYATHTSIRDRQFVNNTFMRFCEVWFALDILLNFVTELKTGNGMHLKQPVAVWARYLTTWFVIDVLSLFPGELVYLQPLIDKQNRRGFLKKSFFRTKAVVKVTRVLRGRHVSLFGRVAKQTRAAGFGGAARLLQVIIKYVPKYWQFLRNMRAVICLRLLRQVHWIRKLWLNWRPSQPFPNKLHRRGGRGGGGGSLIWIEWYHNRRHPNRHAHYYNGAADDDATYSLTTEDYDEDDDYDEYFTVDSVLLAGDDGEYDDDDDDDGVNLSDTEILLEDEFSFSSSHDDDDDMISLVRWDLFDDEVDDDSAAFDDEHHHHPRGVVVYHHHHDDDEEEDDYDDTFGPF